MNNLVLRAWRLLRSKLRENPRLVLGLAIDNCSHLLVMVLILMIPMNKRTISIQIQDRMSWLLMIILIQNQVNQMAMAIPEVMAIPEAEGEFDVPRTTSTQNQQCYETETIRKESASTVVVQEESVTLGSKAARLEMSFKGLTWNYRY